MVEVTRRLVAMVRDVLRRIGTARGLAVQTRGAGRGATPENSSHGFALLIVMVVLLALSLMFAAILQTTRQYIDEAGDRVARLKLSAALDGALVSAVYKLSQETRSVPFGAPTTIRIGETAVVVVVRPEISKLDVNYASVESLRKLLEASGVSSQQAVTIATSVITRRRGSAAPPNEQDAGQEVAPPHPFETAADFALVPGAGPDLLGCLEPDITVFTRASSVDASYASERLRHAIYGNQPVSPSSYYSVVGGDAARPDLYEITETAKDQERDVVLRRQVVIRIAGDSNRPFWILAQASPGPDQASATQACQRLARHAK